MRASAECADRREVYDAPPVRSEADQWRSVARNVRHARRVGGASPITKQNTVCPAHKFVLGNCKFHLDRARNLWYNISTDEGESLTFYPSPGIL